MTMLFCIAESEIKVIHTYNIARKRTPLTVGTFALSYAPRLDISLKKKTTTLKFDLDLPVAVF